MPQQIRSKTFYCGIFDRIAGANFLELHQVSDRQTNRPGKSIGYTAAKGYTTSARSLAGEDKHSSSIHPIVTSPHKYSGFEYCGILQILTSVKSLLKTTNDLIFSEKCY